MKVEDLNDKELVMLYSFLSNGLNDNKTSLYDKQKYKKRMLFVKRLLEDRKNKEQISNLSTEELIDIRSKLGISNLVVSNKFLLNNTLDFIDELINERNEACR